MFDARYHALSLAAVLVALVIGLLLGVAIGDQQLVAGARDRLREDLREDVRNARAAAAESRAAFEQSELYARLTYPAVVRDRLEGRRVVLLFIGERDQAIADSVRIALEPSGGELVAVATLRDPVDLDALAAAAAGTRYEQLPQRPELLEELGRRVGVQVLQGGRLARRVRRALFAASAGELQGAEGVVVARTEPSEPEPGAEPTAEDKALSALGITLQDALVEGLSSFVTPVVGVERADAEPSQVAWYRERDMASVDDVGTVAGRAALVYALDGAAGAYGVKPSADALLPETLRLSAP